MIKKYTNGAWTELAGYKKYGEMVFDFSSFPASFQSGGLNMSDYRIYCTSDGVGEQTENLCPNAFEQGSIELNGAATDSDVRVRIRDISAQPNTAYNFTSNNYTRIVFGYNGTNPVGVILDLYQNATKNVTFITDSSTNKLAIVLMNSPNYNTSTVIKPEDVEKAMLTEGSTAPAQYIPFGYQINAVVRSENLFESNDAEHGYYNNGAFVPNSSYLCSKAVNVIAGQSYTFSIQSNHGAGCYIQLVYLNANDEYVNITSKTYNYVGTVTITGAVPAGASKLKAICIMSSSEHMLTEGSTPPAQYIPYFRTDIPIYIGDTPLAQGEYVDYGEQKVYKYVGGVLTPTDPPVALPALPTIDGETIVDFDNTPKPSRMTGEAIGWTTMTPKIYENGVWT